MEKIEFKSQVCTTREQSERLLEMGLGKATADMMYITSVVDGLGKWLPEDYRFYSLEIGEYHKPIGAGMLHIPAWSLHRLMEIMYNGDMFGFVSLTTHDRNIDTIYELVIANIEGLIKIDKFNKDYLEEKK